MADKKAKVTPSSSKPDTCEGCGAPILRGKNRVAFNISPRDGLLHRQSCKTPLPVGETETEADVKRQYRL